MDQTIKKLQRKLIAMIMVTMTLLIGVVFTMICVFDYQNALGAVYNDLEKALTDSPSAQTLYGDSDEAVSGAKGQHYEFGGKDKGNGRKFMPISVYSVTDAGAFTLISTSSPYSLSSDILESALQSAMDASDGDGTLSQLGLIYAKRSTGATFTVAFTDASAVSGWQSLAQTLAIVGVATLAVLFLISVAFSKWALRPIREAWEKQQRFISDASHELKTPLTVLSANMSILQKNMDKTIASESQWVESSQEELENMRELVDEMLYIASNTETSTKDANKANFEQQDLSKLVEGQVLQFESLAYENTIEFESQVEEGIRIPGDQARLQRLIRTLLDNAFKYSGAGEHVSVNLSRQSNDVILAVTNSGEYISEEDLPHIFERFYRADKARVREGGSYGLGLSIANDIAQEHGGDLSVASSEDVGTTFTVRWTC